MRRTAVGPPDGGSGAARSRVAGERAELWRTVRASAVRVVVVLVVLSALYAFAPLGHRLTGSVVLELTLSVLILAAVTLWEFRNVARSEFPEVKALEAVGVMLPLALLPFAAAYFVMAHQSPASFDTPLTRLDSLYFTITTFATVGFGDIVPKTEAARAVVMAQMVIDLILIGFIAKALLGAARRRRDTLTGTGGRVPPPGGD